MNKNMKNNPYINQNQGMNQNPNNQMMDSNMNGNGQSLNGAGMNNNQFFNNNGMFSNINTGDLIKGALIGAAATYILTNEDVQKKIFKGFAKMSDLLVGGVEEIKERMEDAKAELEAEKE